MTFVQIHVFIVALLAQERLQFQLFVLLQISDHKLICNSLSVCLFNDLISYLIGERQLLFYRRLLCSDNIVLCTLAGLVCFGMLGIAAKYDTKSMYFFTAAVKNAV